MKSLTQFLEAHKFLIKGHTIKQDLRKTDPHATISNGNDIFQLVNNESCGQYLYIVKMWPGHGYGLETFASYANSMEEAACYTIIWLEENKPNTELFADKYAKAILDKAGINYESSYYGVDIEEFDGVYQLIDARKDSELLSECSIKLKYYADDLHFIYQENFDVTKVDKNKFK